VVYFIDSFSLEFQINNFRQVKIGITRLIGVFNFRQVEEFVDLVVIAIEIVKINFDLVNPKLETMLVT
jgi:hypothetical protein